MPKKKISLSLIFILVIAILGVAGIWYWDTHKKSIIRHEVERAIAGKSNGLYNASYSNLELDEVNGNLSVTAFSIRYDSAVYSHLLRGNNAPFLLFNISIPSIQVSGIKTPRALLQKEITGRHLLISHPTIEIFYTNAGRDSSLSVPNKEIYKQILGKLSFIRLDSVVISDAEIITKNLATGKTYVSFADTDIGMYDLSVDSASEADGTRLLYAKELSLSCSEFTWHDKDNRYDYRVDSISLASARSEIRIKTILVRPRLSEEAFAKSLAPQTDRLDFAIHDMQLHGTNFFQLANEVIDADSLTIGAASFGLFRDRTRPQESGNKTGSYPHQQLQTLRIKLNIRKAIARNCVLEYKEKSPLSGASGRLRFTGINAVTSNITNQKELIEQNPLMVFDSHSLLLGRVPLSVKWTFHLGNSQGRFDIDGKMGATDARVFNSLAEPLGPARFRRGKINGMDFSLTGNDYNISGKVKLLYEDLRVTLLEKNNDKKGLNKKTITSIFANLKIKNANPDQRNPPRSGDVDTKRDPARSMFNLAWKGLFQGVKRVTGAE